MIDEKDISKVLNNRIDVIKSQIISGDISLLNLELNPLFQELEDNISPSNLHNYSDTYKNAFELLKQKFEELKNLLKSLDNDKILLKFIKNNPNDESIQYVFKECWRNIFSLDVLSFDFLMYANARYSKESEHVIVVEHLKREKSTEDFTIEIPKLQYTQKLDRFFEEIKEKLPCVFEDVFENERDQIKIYEKFVFLLHLLQSGKIKYQKETNTLYL